MNNLKITLKIAATLTLICAAGLLNASGEISTGDQLITTLLALIWLKLD